MARMSKNVRRREYNKHLPREQVRRHVQDKQYDHSGEIKKQNEFWENSRKLTEEVAKLEAASGEVSLETYQEVLEVQAQIESPLYRGETPGGSNSAVSVSMQRNVSGRMAALFPGNETALSSPSTGVSLHGGRRAED